MSPRPSRAGDDSAPRTDPAAGTALVTVSVDGAPVSGVAGRTLAGVLLAAGRTTWRTGRSGAPRGVFCGIGVCFDCLVTVNGERDVRACVRRARDGDTVTTQSRAAGTSDDAGTGVGTGVGVGTGAGVGAGSESTGCNAGPGGPYGPGSPDGPANLGRLNGPDGPGGPEGPAAGQP